MPPANSPSDTLEHGILSESQYQSRRRAIDSPVPEQASTTEVNEESSFHSNAVAVLQSHIAQLQDHTLQVEDMRERVRNLRQVARRQQESVDRNERRISSMRQRYDFSRDPEDTSDSYGERVPQQQSLYNWAPASTQEGTDDGTGSSVANTAGSQQRVDEDWPRSTRAWPPSWLTQSSSNRVTSERRPEWPAAQSVRTNSTSSGYPYGDSSLRTAALLQSVRRQARIPPHQRSYLESYLMDRERRGAENDTRDRASSRTSGPLFNGSNTSNSDSSTNQARVGLEAYQWYRSRYLEDPSDDNPSGSNLLEQTLTYLERIRYTEPTIDLSLDSNQNVLQVESTFANFVYRLVYQHEIDNKEVLLDTSAFLPPPRSSWLEMGGTFAGSQHAGRGTRSIIHPGPLNTLMAQNESRAIRARRQRWGELENPHSRTVASLTTPTTIGDDRWPVKITVHSYQPEDLRLSGIMEAFNVPDRPADSSKRSITTFLEGEIIDFNKHTLATKSFKADARTDGDNWRKLQPFKDMEEEDIVKKLLNKKWIQEELNQKWILMRWKEKCFITPSDRRSGLTISGFYYISLSRESGHIEGLYYDPLSSPYQQLTLDPERRCFPTYEFR